MPVFSGLRQAFFGIFCLESTEIPTSLKGASKPSRSAFALIWRAVIARIGKEKHWHVGSIGAQACTSLTQAGCVDIRGEIYEIRLDDSIYQDNHGAGHARGVLCSSHVDGPG